MPLYIHPHAESDLNRLAEEDGDGIGYIDQVIEIIDSNQNLFDDLLKEKYHRDYDPPTGVLGLEVKRIACLWEKNIKAMRIRLDKEKALSYRIIYCSRFEKEPDVTYNRDLHILAVVDKGEGYNYQPEHLITQRIKSDYANL